MELEESTRLTSDYTTKLVIKTVWYGHKQKQRSMEQNRKPRDKPTHLWTPYLQQRRQKYTMEKRISLNKQYWENWSTICKRLKLVRFLTPYTKINSKWIKDINTRPKTIKLSEENTGRTLSDINHSKILYDPTSQSNGNKNKN